MRVLLVCSQHWDRFDSYNLDGDTPLTPWQAQFFFWRALKKLGHEVSVFRYTDPTKKTSTATTFDKFSRRMRFPWRRAYLRAYEADRLERNRRLIAKINELKPDIVLVSGGTRWILPDTIKWVQFNTEARSSLLFMDSPLVASAPEERSAVPYYDLIASSDRYHAIQWKELMARNVVALPVAGCDPDYHTQITLSEHERKHYESDLCFVGGLRPDKLYRERVEMLESLADMSLSIWTNDESFVCANPKLAPHYRGSAFGLKMVKVMNSAKICLNNHGCTLQCGGNMRTFEAPSIGAFQLIDRYDPEWFEEGKEIVSYSSLSDLRDKANFYLNNPSEREKIAKSGQERARTQHTYLNRMKDVIEILSSLS